MTRPKTCITDLSTGEVIVREYNDDEMIGHNALLAQIELEAAEAEAKAQAKAELLERLGITEDEAKLLLG
jgi:hypothetical protein